MMEHTLLLVDDEPFSLELMSELLESDGYKTVQADSGEEAWARLEAEHERFCAVLLDKMMPGLNGMELLARIKESPDMESLPVIIQSAFGSPGSIQQGMSAGAFFFLSKPFSRDMLLAVVKAAVSHWDRQLYFREMGLHQEGTMMLLQEAEFTLRTLQEAHAVTALLARACPVPERVASGLYELIANAVEHGNLEFGFQDKQRLLAEEGWSNALQSRLSDPAYAQRQVSVRFQRSAEDITFTITDQGRGFDWRAILNAGPAALLRPHGRGILLAKLSSFDQLEYPGDGNQVIARLRL